MKMYRLVAALVLSFVAMPFAAAQVGQTPAELTARIDKLIQQLDDDQFSVREQAEAALAAIGEPARARLLAAAKDTSIERRQRANNVLRALKQAGLGLRHVGTLANPGLAGAVTLTLSPDGQFVYVPAFQSSAVNMFSRDPITGMLSHRQTIADPDQLGGVVTLRLSPDGKLAVAAAFRSKAVALFSRDATSGELRLESLRRDEPAGTVKFTWPIDATFSADGRFVYVADDQAATIVAFAVEEGKKLNHVQSFSGEDRCFDGARGIAVHPDGKTLYVSSRRPGTLAVLDRDLASGKLSVRQLLRDEQDGIKGLAGTTGACVSRDGKFVYALAGRFEGDQAIGVYRVGADGKLARVEEHVAEESELKNFAGGNDLTISPDGRRLYASGTTSCSLACFDRDAETGKLSFVATLQTEATGQGSDLGANGLEMSPDGKFLYLALENGSAISIFERSGGRP